MKRIQFLAFLILSISAGFMLQGHSGKGGDSYRIFLNDKKLVEQFVNNKQEKTSVALYSSNEKDKLVIHYSHCGKAGSARVVSIKDDKGKVLKTWKFADSRQTGMQLTVKEIINTISKNGSATLHYASKELSPSMKLTTLKFIDGKTAKL